MGSICVLRAKIFGLRPETPPAEREWGRSGYQTALFNTWANITLDTETLKMLVEDDEDVDELVAGFNPEDPNTVWLDALAKVLSRAGGVFQTALPDFEEVRTSCRAKAIEASRTPGTLAKRCESPRTPTKNTFSAP